VTLLLIGLLIGLAAGTLSGLVGIGGGVVIVPALVFLGLSQREASGTSLAALVMPVGLLAVISYARRHEVHFPIAAGIAALVSSEERLPPAVVQQRERLLDQIFA